MDDPGSLEILANVYNHVKHDINTDISLQLVMTNPLKGAVYMFANLKYWDKLSYKCYLHVLPVHCP